MLTQRPHSEAGVRNLCYDERDRQAGQFDLLVRSSPETLILPMRNPGKRRNLALAVALAGVSYMVVALQVLNLDPRGKGTFASMVAALMVTLAGVTGFLVYHVTHRRRERLLRGERLLAKWTVSPQEWNQFRENEAKRPTGGRDNALRKVRATEGGPGIEVVVTEESVLVGDDFYFLPGEMRGLEWFPETPPCYDFLMVTHGKSTSVKWHIRFPAVGPAEPIRRVWDYRQQQLAEAPSRGIPRRRIALAFGIVLIGLLALIVLLVLSQTGSP
jgi:hypothetical protein